MSNKPVILLGAGGHARVVVDVLKLSGVEIKGIFDDSCDKGADELILGIPVLGTYSDVANHLNEGEVVLSIGDNDKRREFFENYKDKVFKEMIHPTAIVSEYAELGRGVQVMAGAIIGPKACVGDNAIINSGAIVEHEVTVGSHSHVAPGAKIGGRTTIGAGVFIGIGATVRDKVKITSGVTIGAASLVIRDIDESGVYVGIPARKIK